MHESMDVKQVLATRDADDTRSLMIMAADAGRFGLMSQLKRGGVPKPVMSWA
jgi:hypothetical protein